MTPTSKAMQDIMMAELDQYLVELDRAQAIDEALLALGIERLFVNHYLCEPCNHAWLDEWSCACDDECTMCGRVISPHKYQIVGEEEDDE